VELARDAERLNALRRTLESNRATCPLFDTPRFVRNLEGLLQQVVDRSVPPLPSIRK
jgi:predicted O-linked N-acetylglucosamine transferase (SPINDLY family)